MVENSFTAYIIYLAPLQGYTDFVQRKAHANIFGCVDKYFCPYISFGKHGQIRNSQIKDVIPENNDGLNLVPQVLFSDTKEFRELCKILSGLGYSEINLNLGCPYPMATKKGRGAALLQNPEKLSEVLKLAFDEFDLRFSIKLRSGLELEKDVFPLIELINRFPVSEVIYHPRIAKQMYKGEVNIDLFQEVKRISIHPLVFNGDIISERNIEKVKNIVPEQTHWMIGRGILMNPFLPGILKNEKIDIENRNKMLFMFHEEIFTKNTERLKGSGHLLQKMVAFWEYFCFSFNNPHKVFKLVKKAGSVEKYQLAVKTIFMEYTCS